MLNKESTKLDSLADEFNLIKLKKEKDCVKDDEKLIIKKLIEKQLNMLKKNTNFQEIKNNSRDVTTYNKIKSKRSLYIDTNSKKHRMTDTHNIGTKHDSYHKYSLKIEASTSRRSILSPCSKSTRATDDEITSRQSINLYNMIIQQKKKFLITDSKINEPKILETLLETSKVKRLEVKKLPEKINRIKSVYDSKSLLKSSPLDSPLREIMSPKKIMIGVYANPTNINVVSSNIKKKINNK